MKSASLLKRAAQAVALALVVTSAPLAQQGGQPAPANVAHLENVEGSVLVGSASGLVSGTKGLELKAGTRILTTAKGRVLVQYDDGCKVQLEPNQRYVINREHACEMRMLMVQGSVPPVSPVTSAALSGSLETATAIGALGVGVVLWNRRDESVSPN